MLITRQSNHCIRARTIRCTNNLESSNLFSYLLFINFNLVWNKVKFHYLVMFNLRSLTVTPHLGTLFASSVRYCAMFKADMFVLTCRGNGLFKNLAMHQFEMSDEIEQMANKSFLRSSSMIAYETKVSFTTLSGELALFLELRIHQRTRFVFLALIYVNSVSFVKNSNCYSQNKSQKINFHFLILILASKRFVCIGSLQWRGKKLNDLT